MDPQQLQVIRYDNAWLDGADVDAWLRRHLPERYIPRRVRLEADEHVCLVVGPRQAGKSTLIWATLVDTGAPALLLNCEDPTIRAWLNSPAAFLADLEGLTPGVPALFFEEVQALPEAGLFLKGLVDRRTNRRIYATGSSAFDLEAQTRESLAGRAHRHLLLPLSLEELMATVEAPPILAEHRRREILDDVLVHGSYPAVYHSDAKPQALARLVESFVIRDASDRFRIRNLPAFRKLLRLMASQVGNLCNYAEWASNTGVSGDTVAEYAGLLEETHIIRLVPPFIGGKRAELTKTPKVFFLDNGVRNVLFGGFAPIEQRPDRGALMEGFVFAELCRYTNPLLDSVRHWRSRSGAEVDFVVEHQGRLLAVEVKAGDARRKLTRSARSFIDAYAPEQLLVVNATDAEPRRHGETLIRYLRPEHLAEQVRAFAGG